MTGTTWAEAITMGDLLRRTAERFPDNELLVFPERRVTYREFTDRVDILARALRSTGIEPGDHVGIVGPNSIEYMVIVFAATSLGAVAVPVNARFKSEELGYVIGHADLKLLFTSDEIADFVDYPAILEETFGGLADRDPDALGLAAAPELRSIVLRGAPRPGFLSLDDMLARAERTDLAEVDVLRSRVRLRDAAVLMYTSGTTAKPKGCVLSHESLVRNGMGFANAKFLMTEADRLWDPLPFFHMSVILPLIACISVGATMIATRRFDPAEAIDALEHERATIAYPAFETIWQAVLTQPDFDQRDLKRLRIVMNVGTPERLRQMQDRVPWASQIAAFGCTEGSGTACYNHPDDPLDDRLRTAGTPFPGVQVKVVGPEGETLAPNERGELCFKGYSVFDGYYKAPAKTAEVLTADGWFHTGDLGSVDEKNQVSYHGRIKDMLKIGGENVAAVEIEDYLATHPAVKIVAVVSAPDATYVEVAAAYIQLVPGTSVTPDEIVDFCRGKIASYKVPRYVRFVEDWPMSGTKIKKYELRQQITEELSSSV